MSPLACHVLNKISASIVVVPSTESVVTITAAFTQTKVNVAIDPLYCMGAHHEHHSVRCFHSCQSRFSKKILLQNLPYVDVTVTFYAGDNYTHSFCVFIHIPLSNTRCVQALSERHSHQAFKLNMIYAPILL